MTICRNVSYLLLTMSLPVAQVTAQLGGGNPMEEIKEIAEAVDRQLKEIDRLLLESGKKGQSRKAPKEMLEQAAEGSKIAEDGIDKLIEKLSEMSQQSSSSSSSSSSQQQQQQQQQRQQQGEQQQQQQNRRENQTPEFVQQPQEGDPQQQQQEGQQQEGQQQEQQPGEQQPSPEGGKPEGGEEQRAQGENRPGNNPSQDPTGPGKPGAGAGEWGGLQPYLNFLKNRGASPKVPEKFRRYYEAYLKNKAKGGKK
ncbi:MAG: hypothetical protein VXY92_01155 [Planctomycetota bacterium]|nr:hypothetical protein [Planctomycetota bacterium]